MRKHAGPYVLVAVLAAMLFSCAKEPAAGPFPDPVPEPAVDPPEEKPEPVDYFLPVMETTDIHGYLIYNDNSFLHYRMAFVADKVKDIRGRGEAYDPGRLRRSPFHRYEIAFYCAVRQRNSYLCKRI